MWEKKYTGSRIQIQKGNLSRNDVVRFNMVYESEASTTSKSVETLFTTKMHETPTMASRTLPKQAKQDIILVNGGIKTEDLSPVQNRESSTDKIRTNRVARSTATPVASKGEPYLVGKTNENTHAKKLTQMVPIKRDDKNGTLTKTAQKISKKQSKIQAKNVNWNYEILGGTECNNSTENVVQKYVNSTEEATSCRPYYKVLDVCQMSKTYYPTEKSRCKGTCRKTSNLRICENISVTRTAKETLLVINCTMQVCSNSAVSIATLDHDYGLVRKYKRFHDIKSLERGVRKAASKSLRHGFNFVFLSCSKQVNATRTEKVEQILLLPPVLETVISSWNNRRSGSESQAGARPPNVNVVVLDSVSRAHFKRVLPKTSKVLQDTGRNKESGTTIVDFPLFQSLAPFTFVNVKSFMTGRQGFSSIKDRDIEFNVLFDKLRSARYQTTVQEDTCWYDKWGSILSSNRKRDRPIKGLQNKKREWKMLDKITAKYKMSGSGLTHVSCHILERYGKTNMFNEGPSFCYDGKPLSSHLLSYATDIHASQESAPNAKPQFTYTHVNIGHESTGKRSCVIDKDLQREIKKLAKLNNTVTIFWSDHGAKTTPYAVDTITGKFETYDSFLFMIVPDVVLKAIGPDHTKIFLRNQKAIVSAADLHMTTIALADWTKRNQLHDLGLFTDKTWRQGCDSLPVRQYSLCKCIDKYRFLDTKMKDAHFKILWMAEFALGMLNDKLNKQFIHQNNRDTRNCQWLEGVYFRDAIYDQKSSRYIFDVAVKGKTLQVFNVQVRQNNKSLALFYWQRTSLYQSFDYCKDKGVSLELCICSKRREPNRYYEIKSNIYSGMFGAQNEASLVAKGDECLILIERNHDDVISFSVANLCKRDYSLWISANGKEGDGWVSSNDLPANLNATTESITFIAVVRKIRRSTANFKLAIKIAT